MIDAAYFGIKGVDHYLEAEALYEHAHGDAPAIGDDALLKAEIKREDPVWAAVGLIAPAAFGLMGSKRLRNICYIDSGKDLLRARPAVLKDLTDLLDTQRIQMAAYYKETITQVQAGGLDVLDETDRIAFAKFQDYFAELNIQPPPVAGSGNVDNVGKSSRVVSKRVPTPGGYDSVFQQRIVYLAV